MSNYSTIEERKNVNGTIYSLFKEKTLSDNGICYVYGISIENKYEKVIINSITTKYDLIYDLFLKIFNSNTYPYNLKEIIEDFVIL